MNYYFLIFIFIINKYKYKPLSQCNKAVTTFYESYDKEGSRGFVSQRCVAQQ